MPVSIFKSTRRQNLILAVVLTVFLGVGPALAESASVPFKPGEKLVFEVSWGGIAVGEAVLEVYPQATIGGEPANHFVLTAKTVGFVDMFFKVRNRIDAYTDTGMTRTVHFTNALEGKHNKNVVITFDWGESKIQRIENTEKWDPLDALPGSFDPLSVFYFTRTQKLEEHGEYERPVTDGKKNVIGRMKIVRREIIEVDGKQYDTFLIEPETRHIGGVFKESEDPSIQVWITADDRRIPVRARSKVVVGSFLGELVSISGSI